MADTTPTPDPQPELPGMAEACQAVGLEALPTGLAQLTKRQREFTLAYLETGNATEAARRAGYGDPASDGAKARANPAVQAVLVQAAVPVAKNADQLIRRVAERSRYAHAMYEIEAAKEPSLRSNKAVREWMAEANRCDSLLGSLLGKIQGVHVTGQVNHAHKHTGEVGVIPAEALPAFAQIRRAVVEERIKATIGGDN